MFTLDNVAMLLERKGESVRGTPKSAPDLDFCIEAARRIELLYRALQEKVDDDPHPR